MIGSVSHLLASGCAHSSGVRRWLKNQPSPILQQRDKTREADVFLVFTAFRVGQRSKIRFVSKLINSGLQSCIGAEIHYPSCHISRETRANRFD